jgi:hypothetical protein
MVVMDARPAIRCLQRALRAWGCRALDDDGVLGPETLGALDGTGPGASALLPVLREAIAGHFRLVAETRPRDAIFLGGWLKRAYDEV